MGKFNESLNLYFNYIIIGLISLATLVFVPLIGSTAELGWVVPHTVAGWFVWIGVRLIVSIVNVLIFHSFVKQGKINVRNNEEYKQAKKLLDELKQNKCNKVKQPLSPQEFYKKIYGKKSIMIFLSTALATVALSQAIITYDTANLITYIFTIIMAVITGLGQMKKVESYYLNDYINYAHLTYNDYIASKTQNKAPNSHSGTLLEDSNIKTQEQDEKSLNDTVCVIPENSEN